MPVTQAVTPKMNTVVSSCSFLSLSCFERAMGFSLLERHCQDIAVSAGNANRLHEGARRDQFLLSID